MESNTNHTIRIIGKSERTFFPHLSVAVYGTICFVPLALLLPWEPLCASVRQPLTHPPLPEASVLSPKTPL